MRTRWIVACAAAALCLPAALLGHGGGHKPPPPTPAGGTWGGPGDTVPPGSGGGGGSAPGPATPGPSGPSAPGPSTPGTGRPGRAATPSGGGPGTPGPSSGPSGPSTGGAGAYDPADWSTWWLLNQHGFLDLRAAIWEPGVVSGSDELFLGHGARPEVAEGLKPSEALLAERVAPALRRALRRESQPGVVSSCLTALSKLGAVPAPPDEQSSSALILGFLRDSNQQIQETAALCGGLLAGAASPVDLAALLAGDARGRELVGKSRVPLRTRTFAAYGLGVLAEQSERVDLRRYAVHQLTQALEEKQAAVDVAVACVNALALAALPPAGEELREGASLPPSASRDALIAYLLELLAEDRLEDRVRCHVPRALARALDPREDPRAREAVAQLVRVVQRGRRGDRDLLRGAIQALGDVRAACDESTESAVREALLDAARNADALARPFALIALAQVASRPGAPEVGTRQIRGYLLTTLAKGDSRLRPWAALALGVMGHRLRELGLEPSRDADVAVRAALADCRTPADLGAYALAAGLRGDLGSSGWLHEKLEGSNDDAARGHIAVALGLMGDRASAERLRELLPEAVYRPEWMRGLAIGLALLRDKGTVPALVRAMEETGSSSVKAVYAWTLAQIGDARAVEPMIALLEDRDVPDLTRANAALGLGFVCERGLLPWNAELARDANYAECPSTLFDPDGGGALNIR